MIILLLVVIILAMVSSGGDARQSRKNAHWRRIKEWERDNL